MELKVNGLTFAYPNSVSVLNGVDLCFSGPKLYCIIGPNGVGKSTLVKCMNKLLTPTEGSITIDGKDVAEMSIKELAKHISFVPVSQGYSFRLTVTDVVLLGRYCPGKWRTDDEDLRKVYKSLKLMELEEYAMRDINELSAGQSQKVNLCKGLVRESSVLILDEPTSNLDVKHQMYITELLRAMAHEFDMTVIMISHDLNIASKFADEIVVMSEPGIVYRCGTPENVITKDTISRVYGVDCDIIEISGKPHVVLNSALSKRQIEVIQNSTPTRDR